MHRARALYLMGVLKSPYWRIICSQIDNQLTGRLVIIVEMEMMRLKSLESFLVASRAYSYACDTRLIVLVEAVRVILLVCRVETLPDVLIV